MSSSVQPGAVVDGKYRVIRCIGEGGMGTVYEGENIRIGRRVAIKVLHAHVAQSAEFAQRFEREARASARIGSPHVCDVLDLGDLSEGERYLVMEFLEGESLEDRLSKGNLPAAQVAPIAFQMLEGLGTMHAAGVIHRDLKPANVFLQKVKGKTEVVKILDFGVAKLLPRADEPSQMTSTGIMMGTPLYMSPEQARGARDVDGRTDIYAASVIFYRALTGVLPHSGENLNELLFKIVLEDARPIRELAPNVDEGFAAIVMRGLIRDANGRYASAREYQEAIASWGALQGTASLRFVLEPKEPLSAVPSVPVHITGVVNTPSEQRPSPAASADHMVVPSRPSGGTPTAWSDDAPEIAKRAALDFEAKSSPGVASVQSGRTQRLDVSSIPGMQTPTGPMLPARTTVPPKRRSGLVIAAVATALAVIAGIGVRLSGGEKTPVATPPSATITAVTTEPPPTPPTAASSVAPDEVPSASAAVSAAVAPTTGKRVVPPPAHPVPAVVTPSAKASIAASAPPPPPPPSASTAPGHRKFRTNL